MTSTNRICKVRPRSENLGVGTQRKHRGTQLHQNKALGQEGGEGGFLGSRSKKQRCFVPTHLLVGRKPGPRLLPLAPDSPQDGQGACQDRDTRLGLHALRGTLVCLSLTHHDGRPAVPLSPIKPTPRGHRTQLSSVLELSPSSPGPAVWGPRARLAGCRPGASGRAAPPHSHPLPVMPTPAPGKAAAAFPGMFSSFVRAPGHRALRGRDLTNRAGNRAAEVCPRLRRSWRQPRPSGKPQALHLLRGQSGPACATGFPGRVAGTALSGPRPATFAGGPTRRGKPTAGPLCLRASHPRSQPSTVENISKTWKNPRKFQKAQRAFTARELCANVRGGRDVRAGPAAASMHRRLPRKRSLLQKGLGHPGVSVSAPGPSPWTEGLLCDSRPQGSGLRL